MIYTIGVLESRMGGSTFWILLGVWVMDSLRWGFPQIGGLLGSPYNKDHSVLGSTLFIESLRFAALPLSLPKVRGGSMGSRTSLALPGETRRGCSSIDLSAKPRTTKGWLLKLWSPFRIP